MMDPFKAEEEANRPPAELVNLDLSTLTFTDEPAPDDLPLATPATVKVPRTYRLPSDLDEWIARTSTVRQVTPSDLVREMLELARATMEAQDRPVSLADVLAAIAGVRSRDAA